MINDFSFTFAEIQTVLYDKNNWDKYLNRPFQLIDRWGTAYGKYIATAPSKEFDASIQNFQGEVGTGVGYGGMTMICTPRKLRFMDTKGLTPPTEGGTQA